MENLEKSSIFVIFLAATKFMEKHLISELIWDGIVVKDHLFAIGYFVEKDSQDQTNFKDIEELTLERKGKICTKLYLREHKWRPLLGVDTGVEKNLKYWTFDIRIHQF